MCHCGIWRGRLTGGKTLHEEICDNSAEAVVGVAVCLILSFGLFNIVKSRNSFVKCNKKEFRILS